MNKHLQYLKYVTRHRWYTFVECCKYGLYWQGLTHDLSKFLPSEWFPYVEQFYGEYGYKFDIRNFIKYYPGGIQSTGIEARKRNEKTKQNFDYAWLKHQKRNPHHHQYWVLMNDSDGTYPLEMPERYVREMVADWISAGYCITGKREVKEWYEKNKDKMNLHENTRKLVEDLLSRVTV